MKPICSQTACKAAQLAVFVFCLFAAFAPRAGMAATSTPVQLTIGSIPSDRMLVVQLMVTSIAVKPVNGAAINILSTPVTVEFAELGDVSEPLGLASLPQGKYSQIVVTTSGCNVTYIGGAAAQPIKREFPRSFTSGIPLQPALQVGTAPLVLNLQLDIASTLPVNLAGAPNFNKPIFRASANNVSSLLTQALSAGRFVAMVGTVTGTSGNTFSMVAAKTGAKLSFATNANTQFVNATLSTLTGLIVEVNGTSNADGSFTANKVEAAEYQSGTVVQGMGTGLVPDSSKLPFVAQNGTGGNMSTALFGSTFSLDASQSPTFVVNTDGIDMTGLDFLQFNWLNFVVGQHVQLETTSQIQPDLSGTSGRISAQTIRLEQQSISGQITNYRPGSTSGSFTMDLVLPANRSSYLNVLNPRAISVHVYQQPGTVLQGLPKGISNGMTVRVRGLLFYSLLPGVSNLQTFAMVAGQISQ